MIVTIIKSEIGPTMEHVKVYGISVTNHFRKCICRILRVSCMMFFTPMVKPSIPIFHYNVWCIREMLLQFCKSLFWARSEVNGGKDIIDCSTFEHQISWTI